MTSETGKRSAIESWFNCDTNPKIRKLKQWYFSLNEADKTSIASELYKRGHLECIDYMNEYKSIKSKCSSVNRNILINL